MPDMQKIIDALSSYTGNMDSLNAFVSVVESEYGENWLSDIQNDVATLPESLKGKFEHAYNYYSATVAWNEITTYLDDTSLNIAEVEERIPVLEYWLRFFGQSGADVVSELRQKLQQMKEPQPNFVPPVGEPVQSEPIVAQENETLSYEQETYEPESYEPETSDAVFDEEGEQTDWSESEQYVADETGQVEDSGQQDTLQNAIEDAFPSEEALDANTPYVPEQPFAQEPEQPFVQEPVQAPVQEPAQYFEQESEQFSVQEDVQYESEAEEDYVEQDEQEVDEMFMPQPPVQSEEEFYQEPEQPKNPALFLVERLERQLNLLNNLHAWISARCVQLGNLECEKYPYYGILVDMGQQVLNDIDAVSGDDNVIALLDEQDPSRLAYYQKTADALVQELEEARSKMESDPMALIGDDVSADAARAALGGLDASQEKEYLGPPPDGFEMLDDPYETSSGELDEDRLKSDYAKIEDSAVSQNVNPAVVNQPNALKDEKELANSPQKGVERKVGGSLGLKPMRKKTDN